MKQYERYKEARLITADEWEHIMSAIPNVPIETDVSWWLCADLQKNENYIAKDDAVTTDLPSVIHGIRPLFTISSDIMPFYGSKILVGNKQCTVVYLHANVNSFDALADETIAMHEFYNVGSYINSPVFRNLIKT